MRIAVLFDNFGPYHVARLSASANVADVLGVEFAAVSGEYAWTARPADVSYQHETLYTDGPSRQCGTRTLRDRLQRLLGNFGPDAVAIPGWSGRLAFAALEWCLRHGVPAIAMSESTAHDEVRRRWREAVKRRCLAACGAGLVGGPPQRDYLVQLGMPANRIFVGYDVVENAHFERGAAAARNNADALRSTLGLPDAYFVASARFIEKKNLAGLLRAYAKYRADFLEQIAATPTTPGGHASWDLVILGDGPLRDRLERLRGELGLQGHVHFPGFKQYDELPMYYGLAGAFIHASLVEQWGLVVNEAMAAGLPVLASSRCGCTSTLVREGSNGFTFDPMDISAMAQAMVRVAALSEPERQDMGGASASIVAEFGPERFAAELKRAADAALAHRVGRRRFGVSFLLSALLASAR